MTGHIITVADLMNIVFGDGAEAASYPAALRRVGKEPFIIAPDMYGRGGSMAEGEEENRMEGIVGLTKLFRNEIAGSPDGSIVVFAGSKAVCAPFAELLAYAVRDKGLEMYFSPLADAKDCRRLMWNEGTGYSASAGGVEVEKADMVVVLGGLAMPKFGCPAEKVREFIGKISPQGGARVVGVCFMDILRRSGWDQIIRFDAIIDATMHVEKRI